MPMNCLLYFEDPNEAEAAMAYGKRLRDEGHRCQFRNGRVFQFEPVTEIGEPPFDTILVSDSVSVCADVYRRWFEHKDCKHRGAVEVIHLDQAEAPATPVDEAVLEQAAPTELLPLPTERVDYLAMPWHVLKNEVGKLTGTKPQNKKEAVAALDKLGLVSASVS